jgi:hypothetical protein
MSIGTGENKFTPKIAKDMTKISFLSLLNEFMMNVDTYTADNYLNHTLPAKDYVRMQIVT